MAEIQQLREESDREGPIDSAEGMSQDEKGGEQDGEQKLEEIAQEVVRLNPEVKQEKENGGDDDEVTDGATSGRITPFPPQPETQSVPSPAVKVEEGEEARGEEKVQEEPEEKQKPNEDGGLQTQSVSQRDEAMEEAAAAEEEDSDESDGPPPGWGSPIRKPQLPSPPTSQPFHSISSPGVKVEEDADDEDEMEGPPPGWASPPRQLQPPSPSLHTQSSVPLSPLERAHVACKSCHRHLSYPQGSKRVRCSDCKTINQAVEERAQMICGFCRRLLSYPPGSRFVQCSPCKQVNYVLQEHEVGQVKCGNCTVLLMYPYGAPSVRCTKCHFVTDIEEHNRRPPLSVQQGRAPPPPSAVAH